MAVPKRLEVVDRDRTANLCDINNENGQVILWHVDIDDADEIAHRYHLYDELAAGIDLALGCVAAVDMARVLEALLAKAKRGKK